MSHYYMPGAGLGLGNLGGAADRASPAMGIVNPAMGADEGVWVESGPGPGLAVVRSPWFYVWQAASLAGTGLGAYHGYKRNRGSVGWAIGWALLGGIFPIITIPVAFAQGYAKPKVQRNRRRRTSRRAPQRRTSRRRR